jgi:hypothetical protein
LLLLLPVFSAPLLDGMSDSFPISPCPDVSSLLIEEGDLPMEWSAFPHPRPETYLEPPLARLREHGETSAGRLFTLDAGTSGKAWAVERVYCTGNSIRAMAFYGMPGFAGYVDALAETEDLEGEPLAWSIAPRFSNQRIARCRSLPTSPVGPLAPIAFDPPAAESSCGLLARYGRFVLAFEIHWTDDALSQDEVDEVVSSLEQKLTN